MEESFNDIGAAEIGIRIYNLSGANSGVIIFKYAIEIPKMGIDRTLNKMYHWMSNLGVEG